MECIHRKNMGFMRLSVVVQASSGGKYYASGIYRKREG